MWNTSVDTDFGTETDALKSIKYGGESIWIKKHIFITTNELYYVVRNRRVYIITFNSVVIYFNFLNRNYWLLGIERQCLVFINFLLHGD